MSEREQRAPSVEKKSSVEPMEGFIRSAVLGLAFGAVLFMVSDQTGLAEPLLRWLNLPGVGEKLGAKQLVIVGILLGVSVNVLDHLARRIRRLFGNLEA
jgi:hypothetical protein